MGWSAVVIYIVEMALGGRICGGYEVSFASKQQGILVTIKCV